jgi:hypothetical protein
LDVILECDDIGSFGAPAIYDGQGVTS